MHGFILFVTYTMKHGTREEFLREVKECGVLEEIRREKGCLGYDSYYPVDKSDELCILEKWEKEEDQIRHLDQPHMDKIKALKSRYVLDTQMEGIKC